MTATIKQQFAQADGARSTFMFSARESALLSKPGVLPAEHRTEHDPINKPYQSTGTRGVENLVGKLMSAAFPPAFPWFGTKVSSKVRAKLKGNDEEIARLQSRLYERDRDAIARIETTQFRAPMRRTLRNFLVVGNFLFQVVPKTYKIKNYRQDNWVTKRSGDGSILFTIVREDVDPLSLSKLKQAKSALDMDDLRGKTPDERLQPLYTRSMWNPETKRWVIEEEVNDQIVNTRKQKFNSFIVGGFEDVGDDYFEGFVEQNKPDLIAFNGMSRSRNEITAEMARVNMVNDPRSNIRTRKLEKAKQGDVLSGRVDADGKVTGIGYVQSDKQADLQGVLAAMRDVKGDLSKNMLMELDQQPTGDRVTATQVVRIAEELDGGKGGIYSAVADQIQFPYIVVVMSMMVADRLLTTVDPRTADLEIMTGFAALAREVEIEKILRTAQILNSLGPGVQARLKDVEIATEVIELTGQDPDRFVKSDDEVAAEQAAEDKRLFNQQAAQQSVETLGKISEQQAVANNAA